MRLNLRVALILLVGLVAVGGVWSGMTTSGAEDDLKGSSAEAISSTLVIDFGPSSGSDLKVLELDQLPVGATGWDLITRSGTSVEGTDQYPTGFVCRLDGWPTEQAASCSDTPAYSEGHWAYYVSSTSLGGEWLLSGQGAATRKIECGGYEGWKWVGPNEQSTPPRVKPQVRSCER
jgi:hypothetical protein